MKSLGTGKMGFLFVILTLASAILLGSTFAYSMSEKQQHHKGPDTILYNGKIITADKRFHVHEAVAIRHGKFVAVGKDRDIRKMAGPVTEMIDLQGKTVLPGLIDSHCHFEAIGESPYVINFGGVASAEEALNRIRAWAERTEPGQWIVGGGWHPLVMIGRYLTRWEIDSVAPNNPVYLPTVGHASMTNSLGLQAAGITKDTPDPPSGIIYRDSTGEPTGVLEETAQNLVSSVVPPYTLDQRAAIRKTSMAEYNKWGFTSVILGLGNRDSLDGYLPLWSAKEMTLRVSMMYTPADYALADYDAYEAAIRESIPLQRFGDEWLKVTGIKMIMDGGMTLKTAYVRDPYPGDPPGYYGFRILTPERLNRLVSIANKYGWRVGIHAVGDAAIDKVLDAYENANGERSILHRRFVIIHGSLMQRDQMVRARHLGVRTDIQNVFMWDKAAAVKRFLGEDRANRACPQRWLIDIMGLESGGAGSDFFVNTYNPFINMYVMITRKDPNGTVFGYDQAVTREEAIRLYTNGSAHYTFDEHKKGSIEPGKLADLAVISEDILTCPDETIKSIKALMTIVGGKIVYRDPAF